MVNAVQIHLEKMESLLSRRIIAWAPAPGVYP
jgi:hypothetical protein